MSVGLFRTRGDERDATSAVIVGLPAARSADPLYRQAKEQGLHRYCSGCSRETEHVLWAGGEASIPAIRRPAAEAASGTTICVDCGQWRTAASIPNGPAWSSWPRTFVERSESATLFDDGPLETAAENEGMPPLRDPSPARRRQPTRTMKKAIATY
jgi:hypothetical protein